jgi:hypothetical protein
MLWFICGVPMNSGWFRCLCFDELIKKKKTYRKCYSFAYRAKALEEIGTKVTDGSFSVITPPTPNPFRHRTLEGNRTQLVLKIIRFLLYNHYYY